jgi:hypothetical protein
MPLGLVLPVQKEGKHTFHRDKIRLRVASIYMGALNSLARL